MHVTLVLIELEDVDRKLKQVHVPRYVYVK